MAFLPLLGHVQKDEFTLTLGAIAIPAATGQEKQEKGTPRTQLI